jgi:hypothetical protein
LLEAFIPFTYHASLRAQAHREKGYSAENVEGLFCELRPNGVLGSSARFIWEYSIVQPYFSV